MTQGSILSIVNNKGGTGKTTIATHLGVALSKKGKRTLVVDNDTQCNTTQILGNQVAGYKTMFELFGEDAQIDLDQYCTPTNFPNLFCVTNIIETSGYSISFSQKYPDSLYLLRDKIRDQAVKKFDYILIDCPPTLEIPMGMALCASDAVIVPIEIGSVHSVKGLNEVLVMIQNMQNHNPDLRFLKLVMNKADRRTSVAKVMIQEIQRDYPDDHFKTVLPICTAFQQAEYLNRTLYEHKGAPGKGTTAYKHLAEELINEVI